MELRNPNYHKFSAPRASQLSDASVAFTDSPSRATKINQFLQPSDTFNRKRFWQSAGAATIIYSAAAIGLWEAWYKNYDLEPFHTFDDRGEWLDMDKFGHAYTAYHYARWAHQGLRWSGVKRPAAVGLAVGVSTLLQTTVEVMDGYSSNWGFSWSDVAMNAAGAGLFAGQELIWHDQRINVKLSSWNAKHSTAPLYPTVDGGPPSSLANRAADQYGDTPWQRFIKDYNGQTVWLSTNPWVLAGSKSPKLPWLNLAVGYSVDKVYGAYGNGWSENGFRYSPGSSAVRQREYVFSLDIDFERIPARSPVLKTFLHLINHFKFPAPALINQQHEGLQFRWLYY